jgi:hypothetical protein
LTEINEGLSTWKDKDICVYEYENKLLKCGITTETQLQCNPYQYLNDIFSRHGETHAKLSMNLEGLTWQKQSWNGRMNNWFFIT